MSALAKSLILRFIRGSIAGAVATMVPLLPSVTADVGSIKTWLTSLALSGFIGAITGLILTIDKAVRSKTK